MRGRVIGFDPISRSGALTGDDGRRYDFTQLDWRGGEPPPRTGSIVDFLPDGAHAAQIYALEPEYRPQPAGQAFWVFYFSPYGRASRFDYWVRFFLPVLVIGVVLGAFSGVAEAVGNNNLVLLFDTLKYLFSLATPWPGIAVLIKRIHDRDKSGWLAALPYALIIIFVIGVVVSAIAQSTLAMILAVVLWGLAMLVVALWFFIEFGCLKGTTGPNTYGPDPVCGRYAERAKM